MESPENPENPEIVQEIVQEIAQEIADEQEIVQESVPEKEGSQGASSTFQVQAPVQAQTRPGRPRKTEEEKKETRRQKYLRAKERRSCQKEGAVFIAPPADNPPSYAPLDTVYFPPEPVLSPIEMLRQVVNTANQEHKKQKAELYDSWFAHLRR